jgi:hypothetical protein
LKTGGVMRLALYSKKLRPNDHISGKILTISKVAIAGAMRRGPRRSGLISQAIGPLRERASAAGLAVDTVTVISGHSMQRNKVPRHAKTDILRGAKNRPPFQAGGSDSESRYLMRPASRSSLSWKAATVSNACLALI